MLKQYLETLRVNPLFQLSLGSKELFHSNFIAYMIGFENNMEFNKRFVAAFSDLDYPQLETVHPPKRERDNFDLIIPIDLINSGHTQLVIENKVKSLPSIDQLNDYYQRVNGDGMFYLLSLNAPGFDMNEVNPWVLKTYKDLSDCILQNIEFVNNDIVFYEVKLAQLLQLYVEFVQNLHNISQALSINNPENELYNFYNDDYLGVNFRDFRLHDLLYKIKHDCIKHQINYKLEGAGFSVSQIERNDELIRNNNPYFFVGTGFSNSQGITDLKLFLRSITIENSQVPLFLVLQLQGYSFRFACEIYVKGLNRGTKEKLRNIIYLISNSLREEGLWMVGLEFNDLFDKVDIGNGEAYRDKNPNRFCKFGDHFLYKYNHINQDVPVQSIINFYLYRANFLINNIDSINNVINAIIGN